MTLLINDVGRAIKPKEIDRTWKLREDAAKQPLGTLYKVRSGETSYLLLKVGRNNFLDLYNKVTYRPRHRDSNSMTLVQAGDSTKRLPVHEFVVQVAILQLR